MPSQKLASSSWYAVPSVVDPQPFLKPAPCVASRLSGHSSQWLRYCLTKYSRCCSTWKFESMWQRLACMYGYTSFSSIVKLAMKTQNTCSINRRNKQSNQNNPSFCFWTTATLRPPSCSQVTSSRLSHLQNVLEVFTSIVHALHTCTSTIGSAMQTQSCLPVSSWQRTELVGLPHYSTDQASSCLQYGNLPTDASDDVEMPHLCNRLQAAVLSTSGTSWKQWLGKLCTVLGPLLECSMIRGNSCCRPSQIIWSRRPWNAILSMWQTHVDWLYHLIQGLTTI